MPADMLFYESQINPGSLFSGEVICPFDFLLLTLRVPTWQLDLLLKVA